MSSCELLVVLVTFFIKLDFFRQIVEKSSKVKCHENLSSCSMWTDGRRDGRRDRRPNKERDGQI